MKRVIRYCSNAVNAANSLKDVINHISNKLNTSQNVEYTVTKDPDHTGLLIVTNLNTGKKKLIAIDSTKKESNSKNHISWSDDFTVNKSGEVYDSGGNFIGIAKVWPAKPNATRYRRNYKLKGTYDHNIADLRNLDESEDSWNAFKETLE